MNVLAGDVGGTNTRLAVWPAGARQPVFTRSYGSGEAASLDDLVARFVAEFRAESATAGTIDRGCIGIAGIVRDGFCRATNLPWTVSARSIADRLGIESMVLINDFAAMAWSVPELADDDVVVFGGGAREPQGPIAVLGPGTGLGEAFLIWSRTDAAYKVIASEGGHSDFAPRSPLEAALMQFLTRKHGRVSNERVLSGRGLANMFEFFGEEETFRRLVDPVTRREMAAEDPAAVITRRALSGTDPICEMAVHLFCSVLGAVAGNLALTVLATGGVFVGGGIAPRLLRFLSDSGFREAFQQKGRLSSVLEKIPVAVIRHPHPGLLGAAAFGARTQH